MENTLPGLIVHEWIERRGGAEVVMDNLVSLFPKAHIYCLWNDDPTRFPRNDVRESVISRTFLRRVKPIALLVMPIVWRGIRTRDQNYNWILASSHLFAHQVRVRKQRPHKFVYVHTPARYIWEPDLDSRGSGVVVRLFSIFLRRYDRLIAQASGVSYAANSDFVRERIQRAWDVDARVIYPPVDVETLQAVRNWATELTLDEREIYDQLPSRFVIGASRFVPYKRLDQVIASAAHAGVPVVIAGSGPQEDKLRALARGLGADATFIINPSDAFMRALIQSADALLFPGIEDFGIIPVEAMALGTPAIVNSKGGAAESVVHGVTGFHVDNFDDVRAVARTIGRLPDLQHDVICEQAATFSAERFRQEILDWMRSVESVSF